MKLFFLLFSFFVIASDVSVNTVDGIFSKSLIQEIKCAGDKIIAKYPPEEYHYIGLGRSPSAIMAYIQLSYPEGVTNLPLSSFRYGIPTANGINLLTTEFREKLYKHFDLYLLSDEIKRKEILLIDYSVTGASLISAHEEIKAYLKKTNIIPLVLTSNEIEWFQSFKFRTNWPYVNVEFLNKGLLTNSFEDSYFDKYSQFGEFLLEKTSLGRAQENPFYELMKRELEQALINI